MRSTFSTFLGVVCLSAVLASWGCKKDEPAAADAGSAKPAPRGPTTTGTTTGTTTKAPPSDWSEPLATKAGDKLTVGKTADVAKADPMADYWKDQAYFDVLVKPQQEQKPQLKEGTIDRIRVQALSDGKNIAFRLTWYDETLDGNVDVSRFTDTVALEFPLTDKASPQMGAPGDRVQILSWKALWQKDIDVGFQDVQDLHPNFWSDLYWFAEGDYPWKIPEAFQKEESKQWFVALSAGNPVAAWGREEPVVELMAEGPGTLTQQADSSTTGRGVWKENIWAVVFVRPLETGDENDYKFDLSKPGKIAFAVWDGTANNVGARKHWSTNWVELGVTK